MMQLDIMEWLAAGALLVRALCVLNAMTWRTWLPVKAAYLILALAAFGLLVAPFYSRDLDDYTHPILVIAFTVILLLDRRLKLRLNHDA